MVLSSGSNTNVVQITNGATVSELKPIGYGTATVKFYSKATGELLSFNYITVIK
ncbi:TPA: hypothetical protein PYZ05_002684 [Staphylococcus aureus]|nr:hypothetical protein [Staphylococcus aureus]